MDGGRDYLIEVVGRNVCRHTDGNTRCAIQQQVGYLRRQYGGLFEGAVEIRLPIHRSLAELREQHLGVSRQSRFGVAHGGE
ncbi:MAG: Uncharacterised protein [Halieaceae bacterium]|nr:MAG: Uncharacterised protein [Halieaceae bacterium]